MNIWIDITNSPHVNFFADLIRDFRDEGHNVLITCRPLANTIELLDLQGFDYEIVGRHYGRSRLRKISGFVVRCFALYRHLRKRNIDVAISHSSFYSPLVARSIGARCVYLNDNEHAAGNRIAFRFADIIMVPEYLTEKALLAQGARKAKLIHYPGVKEGVYLWALPEQLKRDVAAPPTHVRSNKTQPTFVLRPEPWAAEYYKGNRDFLGQLLLDLTKHGRVILLPRGEEQAEYYRDPQFSAIEIPATPLTLQEFYQTCDIFVGAGGTMTREAAVLGIPTISIYQDKLLAVDEFLVDSHAMVHNPHADAAFVTKTLADTARRAPHRELLEKGKEAFELIKFTLKNLAQGQQEHNDA